jgi:hypothetical protein
LEELSIARQDVLEMTPLFDYPPSLYKIKYISGRTDIQWTQIFMAKISTKYSADNNNINNAPKVIRKLRGSIMKASATNIEAANVQWLPIDEAKQFLQRCTGDNSSNKYNKNKCNTCPVDSFTVQDIHQVNGRNVTYDRDTSFLEMMTQSFDIIKTIM